jgi:hypothetical protein
VSSCRARSTKTKRISSIRLFIRYQFPLATGERWNQRVVNLEQEPEPYGGISRSVTVGGYEKITTPAGTFDAIGMRIFMQMDDETFWRWPTQCNYLVWYAPAIGAPVREQKRSEWRDKGAQDAQGYHPGRTQPSSWSRSPAEVSAWLDSQALPDRRRQRRDVKRVKVQSRCAAREQTRRKDPSRRRARRRGSDAVSSP